MNKKTLACAMLISILIISSIGIINISALPMEDDYYSIIDRGFPIRHAVKGDWACVQSFVPEFDVMTNIEIYSRITSQKPSFDLTLQIREGSIDGPVLAEQVFPRDFISPVWMCINFDFEDIAVTPDTEYFLIVALPPTGLNNTFSYEIGYIAKDIYEHGTMFYTNDTGISWINSEMDLYFIVYGLYIPVVEDIPDDIINEGKIFSTINLDDYVTDVEDSDSDIIWSYSGNFDLSVSIVDRVATITIPDEDWFGSETIIFTATDTDGLFDLDDAVFTVNPVNDAPVACNDSVVLVEDSSVLIDVLANDTDVEDIIPKLDSIVSDPLHGSALIKNDKINYIADPDFYGSDSLTYKVVDSEGLNDTAVVTIIVTPDNDAPVAILESKGENSVIVGFVDHDLEFSGEESYDIDGTIEQYNWRYTTVGTPHFPVAMGGGEIIKYRWGSTGTYNVTLKVFDNQGAEDTDNITVIIIEDNHAPVANDDAYSTDEDTVLNVISPGVLSNDSDSDEDPIYAILVSDVSNGILILKDNGSFIYTPNPDFNGLDSFTYRANDSATDSNIATVNITVNPVNDAPVADANGSYEGFTTEMISFNGSNSYDIDGNIVNYTWDFGDETFGHTCNITHCYTTPGIYTVILNVTDDDGAFDVNVTYVNITIDPNGDDDDDSGTGSSGDDDGDDSSGSSSGGGSGGSSSDDDDDTPPKDDDEENETIIQPNRPPEDPTISGVISGGNVNISYLYRIYSTDLDNDAIKYIIDWDDGTITTSKLLENGTIFEVYHNWTKAGVYEVKAVAIDENNATSGVTVLTVEISEETTEEKTNYASTLLLGLAMILAVILLTSLLIYKKRKGKSDENSEETPDEKTYGRV